MNRILPIKRMMLAASGVIITLSAAAETYVDFSRIEHWTGSGSNRAALVIRFSDDSDAFVWGYRWEDGEYPSGEDMFRAVCGNSTELTLLTQFTGNYGCTVAGVGMSDGQKLLDCLTFDFDKAAGSPSVSFGYYEPNTFMGQTSAPGDEVPSLCSAAIALAAGGSHVIDHPLDSKAYGYPAYDYDFWQLDTTSEGYDAAFIWKAGWYDGYWSYWMSDTTTGDYAYSGVGFSSSELVDGCVDGWRFSSMSDIGMGSAPNENAEELNYRPATTRVDFSTSVGTVEITGNCFPEAMYTLSGIKVAERAVTEGLPAGIYLVVRDGKVTKRIVR